MSDRVLSGKAGIKGMQANSTAVDHAFMYPRGGGGVPSAKPVVKSSGPKGNANTSVKGTIAAGGEKVVGK